MLDVIGVAKSASEVSTIISKTTSKELKKREVHLVDSTNTEVKILLVLLNIATYILLNIY